MRYIFAVAFMMAMTWACGGGDAGNDTPTTTTASADKPNGEKIYKQYCVTCHGLYGDMGASGAHDLTASELSVDERMLVITNGRGTMTPFKSLLDEDEIAAVAEYTLQLKQ